MTIAANNPETAQTPANATRVELVPFCWHGWRTRVPANWDLVRLEGDYDAGYAVFTHGHAPRFVLRWTKAVRASRAEEWIEAARRKAGGDGRAVWTSYSAISRRGVVATLETTRVDADIPRISDTPPDVAGDWSVFGLRCTVPTGFVLRRHALNAGDLCLHFAATRPARWITVRELAPARVVLRRSDLDALLARQETVLRARYRKMSAPVDTSIAADVAGISRRMAKRRRLFFVCGMPREVVTYALHDRPRDRVVIVQGTAEGLVRSVAATVGQPIAIGEEAGI